MKARHEKLGLELCDEALFLLRRAPAQAWTFYVLGTAPFLLGLLYFWVDMTRGVNGERDLVGAALAMAALFVWMKTWQAIFAGRLRAIVSGIPAARLTVRGWFRIAIAQSRIQPFGLFIIPLASTILIPFAWAFAYYQNATALGTAPPGKSLHALSLEQARLWPRQNHIALIGISGLGFIVLIDLLIMMFLAPQLLITFFGVKEVIHPSIWMLGNTTFLAVVFTVSYLLVDPLIKAFYTLRCFYGQSLATGEDLRARLTFAKTARKPSMARLAKAVAIVALLFGSVHAAEPSAKELNQKIEETLKSPEYNWRFPREVIHEERGGWLREFFTSVAKFVGDMVETIADWIGKFLRWLFSPLARRFGPAGPGVFSPPSLQEILVALAVIVVAAGAFLFWKNRKMGKLAGTAVAVASAVPDLAREDVTADQLPQDEWLALAARLAGEGELRLAIRALFLSALATMAGRQWIVLAKFKSNRDYEREFRRRAASAPQAIGAFGALTQIYNRVWYGLHDPSPDLLAQCEESVRVLKS